ncbi:Probable alpha-galactosidase A [Eumeta japonica]|uniref:Probable alpha-galactosidase A n=1 Tax=Eumeta variegata TaxID=151549 RepID=A0A4C1WIU1_EUMVA|nr:Probable alpha-galactosidase A [Eumeta japonica]
MMMMMMMMIIFVFFVLLKLSTLNNQVFLRQVHSKGLKFGIYEDYGNFTCAGYPGVVGHLAGGKASTVDLTNYMYNMIAIVSMDLKIRPLISCLREYQMSVSNVVTALVTMDISSLPPTEKACTV